MAATTPPATSLTLVLTDDLADTPGTGVERAVDRESFVEAETILAAEGFEVTDGPATDVWLLRDGAHPVSALVAERDGDAVTLLALATLAEHRRQGHGERLVRAVLGHYALEGAPAAAAPANGLSRRVGFS